jgi:hypothetical protein
MGQVRLPPFHTLDGARTCCRTLTAAAPSAGIWATVLLPAKPLIWPAFLKNPVLALLRAYFNVCVVVDWQQFDLQRRYVYAGRSACV